ncbi:Acetyl-CoA synthetase-like protein [Mycena indigotica]|uniref:Acetyl-CoA synthetase-like protein n=1 Tax=Mycena indigotica TaxID=2126181 RepID=A0A8H6W0R3_9AGAR|nr:Acetyl-CoA synthetase-like protein [Mycena indigotica]KAF7297348.1 Acetyl-CoA synthetase-like protein [Mycena indigotica]
MADTLPTMNLDEPLPEHFLRTARAGNGENDLGYIINEGTTTEITRITWRRGLRDIRCRAKQLSDSAHRPARKAGDSQLFVVGLLHRTGYNYFVTLCAILMLRWTPLVLSPRNSPSGTVHLLKAAQASHLISDSDLFQFSQSLKSDEPLLEVIKAPDLGPDDDDDLWSGYAVESPEALVAEVRNATSLYMHTSGSTGHPKLIPIPHRWFLGISAAMRRQSPTFLECTYYTMMPFFHAIGVLLSISLTVGSGARISFLNLRQPPSATIVLRHISVVTKLAEEAKSKLQILLAPSILEDIVDGRENIDVLKSAIMVMFGGAPLRQDVGDALRKAGVPIQSVVGMTEVGPLGMLELSDDANWNYMRLNDMYEYYFRGVDGEPKEMIVLPKENIPAIINHHQPKGFATGDLWIQHPQDPELWRIVGRAGDITVLSNGEKTDNKQLETLLCTSPLIQNATVFGAGRFLNGVIISPAKPLPSDEFLDAVWPHIVTNVNSIVPQHSRLIRPLVLATDQERPFILTDKQTVNRKLTLQQYEQEIAAAYTIAEDGGYEEVAVLDGGFAANDLEGITAYMGSVIRTVLQRTDDIPLDKDLFELGLDSLMAMRVRAAILAALKKSGNETAVPRNVVYMLPTLSRLIGFLSIGLERRIEQGQVDVRTAISETIVHYTKDLPVHRPSSEASVSKVTGDTYAVTGTTGSLGSFFVAALLGKPEVRKVYLLNRKNGSRTIEQRHESGFQDRGLDYSVLSVAVECGRAVYLDVTLGEPKLGLDDEVYQELTTEITHIVHCAWMVNFNLILPSFKAHIAGVRNLLDLSLSSALEKPAHLTFLSSIGVVGGWSNGPAPEKSLESPATCLDQGYAHSKYVAEKLIEYAAQERPGLEATIVRSGQLAGAEGSGAWPRSEFIPTLMRSCKELKIVPGGLQDVRWLPVNIAAEVLYQQIHFPSKSQPAFYGLENGVTTPWSLVAETLSALYDAPIVPAKAWLDQIRARTDLSAHKLLSFFEDYVHGGEMARLQIDHAREAAGSLLEYEVTGQLVNTYAEYAS